MLGAEFEPDENPLYYLEDAKDFADKLFSDVASVEVLDTQDNDKVVYGRYPEDESLK